MNEILERVDPVMARPKKPGYGGYRNYATKREARMGETIHKLRQELNTLETQLTYVRDKLKRTREIDDAALEYIKSENQKLTKQLASARRQIRRFRNRHKASPL